MPFNAYASLGVSTLGSVFAKLNGSPQNLHPARDAAKSRSDVVMVMVMVLVEGNGQVAVGPETAKVGPGDIFLLDPARDWRVELHTNFSAIFVKLKEARFLMRLMRTGASDLNRIPTING